MIYLKIFCIWLVVGVFIGLAGIAIGPGIAMGFLSMIVVFLGAFVNCVQQMLNSSASATTTGLAQAAGILAVGFFWLRDALTIGTVFFFLLFILTTSILGNWLVAWMIKVEHPGRDQNSTSH